jgi:hypothetical protein
LSGLSEGAGLNKKRIRSRYNKRYGRDPKGAASNAWLEAKYGWIPFMTDVHDATMTLQDVVDQPDRRIGRVRTSGMLSPYKTRVTSSSILNWQSVWIHTDVLQDLSYRYVWRFAPNVLDLPGRFGLTNPAEVIWELVPFSFVADWFLPIGDYLSGLDAPLRFTHVGGTAGFRSFATWQRVVELKAGQQGTCTFYSNPSSNLTVRRRGIGAIPSPSLASLTFRNPISGAGRAITAIALLQQQLKRF